jgi:heme A synthase
MNFRTETARRRFAWFAWGALALNIPVILWGAWVRISYSGDGCGAHWPFCNGQLLPSAMTAKTMVEFSHRLTSGFDSIAIAGLVAFAFLIFPAKHVVRRYAVASFCLLMIEALLGAALVLLRHVAHDQSAGRIWSMSAHLVNTLLLLGTMALTAWLAQSRIERFRLWRARLDALWSGILCVIVAVTGAVTALGDTLFPESSLFAGMQHDFSGESPMLLRLRVAHPAIAILGAGFVIWTALTFLRRAKEKRTRKSGLVVAVLCGLQLLAGAANIALLAPGWMQVLHLFLADLLWIAVVVMIAESARLPRLRYSYIEERTAVDKPA